MIIKRILASIFILMSASLFAMQPEQPALAANIVTLVSAEGDEFQLPLDAAQEAGTLASMLAVGTSAESAERKFHLNNISSPVMKEITALMHAVHNNLYLKNNKKAFQDALAPYLKSTLLLDPAFLRAIDFLDFGIIKDLIAYKLAQRIISTQTNVLRIFAHYMTHQKAFAPEITFAQVKQIIEKALGSQEAAARLLDNIAWYSFLLFDNPERDTPEPTLGHSIQDYLDYNPKSIQKRFKDGNFILDLYHLRLVSLEGLDHIQNITSVPVLNLSSNRLQQIQPHAFAQLHNLQFLALDHNQLQQIEPNTFVGLQNVQELYLSNNQLQQIQPQAFAGLSNLQALFLNDNQLQEIQPQVFVGLQNLRLLKLGHNPLTQENKTAIRAALPVQITVRF